MIAKIFNAKKELKWNVIKDLKFINKSVLENVLVIHMIKIIFVKIAKKIVKYVININVLNVQKEMCY